MRIIVAEDDPIILTGFSSMLESIGYEIVGQAVDGESAARLIIELRPDLILMDINMPKMDGITVLEQVNKVQAIPCIIITGYRDEEQIKRAANAGVYGYLHKPVDEYALRAEIEMVTQRHSAYCTLEKEKNQALNLLESRKLIERAKGIIMEKAKLSEADAYRFLQKKSRDKNLKLVDLARDIINADELFK